jgi:hypothetical protein
MRPDLNHRSLEIRGMARTIMTLDLRSFPKPTVVRLTYHAFSRERPPRAEAEAARRLPRLNDQI